MARPIKTTLKLHIPAGEANPAPPLGPALGGHGVNIQDFCSRFNEATATKKGEIIPCEVIIYEDGGFDFKLKSPLTSELLKKAASIEKGSGDTPRTKAGKISRKQLEEIAKTKIEDLNAYNLEEAIKIVEGTARSMGIDVEES